jgi:hypothetical protein
MGYNIIYEGKVNLDKPLDDEIYRIITGLINTRRMQWDAEKLEEDGIAKVEEIGRWGEFFFEGGDYSWAHKTYRKYLLRGNFPPLTQPSLYCGWSYQKTEWHWNGIGEKKLIKVMSGSSI